MGLTDQQTPILRSGRIVPSTFSLFIGMMSIWGLFWVGYISSLLQTPIGDSHSSQINIHPSFGRIPTQTTNSLRSKVDDIPVFYNLFIHNQSDSSRVRRLVEEQFNEFLPIHKPIYVNSIGASLDFNSVNDHLPLNTTSHPIELLGAYDTATEHVTLKHIWNYCRSPENRNRKVVYLHSKGSHTSTPENDKLRRFITAGTLSRECANMPQDKCNVCSSRFSPIPHPHTSGNMWLAGCDYITKLLDPETFEQAMNSQASSSNPNLQPCNGRGRYSAEHWILSHPSVKPCDLYTKETFTWNYEGMPTVQEFRQNIQLAPFPRFPLETYLKPHSKICPFRGTLLSFRLNEYDGLYKMKPPSDWWGFGFFKSDNGWWLNQTWAELPEFLQAEIIKLGYNEHLWDSHHRPYKLWARDWNSLVARQRKMFEEKFAFDEELWNTYVKQDLHNAKLVEESVLKYKPNTSFDRCTVTNETRGLIHPWYTRTQEDKGRWLGEHIFEHSTKPADKKRVLIIASVPRDETHLLSLWTELECFAKPVDHVLIAAPTWGKDYVEHVMKLAKMYIPHFAQKEVSIEARYFLNNRYDVGLWCDAYSSLNSTESYHEYGLINDSVFALRKFSAIYDNLQHQNLEMTSMSYSFTYKFNLGVGPEEYWVESVFRGFNQKGIDTFQKYSCVNEEDPMFCPGKNGASAKACIVNNFEHDLSKQYPCKKVQGLFPTEPPELLNTTELWELTWIKNTRYWRMLIEHMGFPIAKINEPEMSGGWDRLEDSLVAWKNNPLLKNCTKNIKQRMDELFKGLDFEKAKPFFQQRWDKLPSDLQTLAGQQLGYKQAIWDKGQKPLELKGKRWHKLTEEHKAALSKLGCSKLMYKKDLCYV